MNDKIIKDVSASIRQKLLNLSVKSKRPFEEVLQYYMIERFIYRLSISAYKDLFILKGALMLHVWQLSASRATRDIDLLGTADNSVENISSIIKDICLIVDDDGVIYDENSVQAEVIQEQNSYSGIRAKFNGDIGRARARMQIDIGFGDVIHPEPIKVSYPTLLPNISTPDILGYTPETLISEKVHSMVRHGTRNSRIKDFFDIWFLSRQFLFEGQTLSKAIQKTFANREMPLSKLHSDIFSDEFKANVQMQRYWTAFINKNISGITLPNDFDSIMNQIALFISPIFEAIERSNEFTYTWVAPGPWK
tara:strand:+ start:829 stop:1749 length:921 start_codon:yes stop_codon:yes gene_type:complete